MLWCLLLADCIAFRQAISAHTVGVPNAFRQVLLNGYVYHESLGTNYEEIPASNQLLVRKYCALRVKNLEATIVMLRRLRVVNQCCGGSDSQQSAEGC